ncbi:DNA polymerase III subunit gamma/tau [candidate division KSB1 bacterium]|nr:DNA polymerase III subunit gamma/tau [candidate division KSB1 bacterium]
MSYLVLARKYRPMFFADVVGQEHVTVTLQNAIQHNRVANAYLFSGPRGVGKTTVARLLAKALNCDSGPTVTPCNSCSSCIEINESRSLDVFEIDGASNRGIDEVRNLREGLRYSPTQGKHRIYIIDEVHMLTNEAFNALLKTLEEPPPRVLFIFATTESHKVPATILSRCQKFDFKRLTNKLIMDQLYAICAKEEIDIDQDSLRLIAGKADGGMRDAQSILDQIIAFSGKNIQQEGTARLLGVIDRNLFFRVSDLISANDVGGAVVLADELFIEGLDFSDFLIGLADHLRNLLIARIAGEGGELDVSEVDAERYLAKAQDFSSEDLLRYLKITSDTENLIRRSANPRLHVEVALIKMVKMGKSVQLSELLKTLTELKKKPEPVLNPQKSADKPSLFDNNRANRLFNVDERAKAPVKNSGSDFSLQASDNGVDIGADWARFVGEVKQRKIALGTFLHAGRPGAIRGDVLEVQFPPHCAFHMSSVERSSTVVQQLLREILGVNLRLRCVIDENAQPENSLPSIVDKRKEFEELAQNNPTVQHILDLFDAEFVK